LENEVSEKSTLDLADVLKANPYTVPPLLEYHDRLLRHPGSPFTIAERELIAAYVSGLNQCQFCFGAHKIIAATFDFTEEQVELLFTDIDKSGVEKRLLPVLSFVKKLTLTPSKVVDADREAIIDADWPQQAIFDAASICGLFNLMNRIVEGTGVKSSAAIQQAQRDRHQRTASDEINLNSYQDYGRKIGVLPE